MRRRVRRLRAKQHPTEKKLSDKAVKEGRKKRQELIKKAEAAKAKKITSAVVSTYSGRGATPFINKKKNEPQYKTKQVDLTTLIPVRIDHKTIIYAKPGQNTEEVKARYFAARNVEPTNTKFLSAT